MLPNGWVLSKYNKSGSYMLLDADNAAKGEEAVHTVLSANMVKQVFKILYN